MMHVEIRVRGELNSQWSGWFDDLLVEPSPTGETRLSGELPDQAALYGLLSRLRDLGLELCSVVTEYCDHKGKRP